MNKNLLLFAFVLFTMLRSIAVNENLSRTVLLDVLEFAAHMEFGYIINSGKDSILETAYLDKAQNALLLSYKLLTKEDGSTDNDYDDAVKAYTLSRVGWFFLRNRRTEFPVEKAKHALNEALRLQPENEVYAYMVSKVVEPSKQESMLMEILKNNPKFPEALNDLLSIRLQQKNFDEADSLRNEYIENLKYFNPKLSYFYHSYPSPLANIIIKKGQTLSRTKYHFSLDRFEFAD